MSGVRRSYFRRLIYSSPLLLIIGGVTMVFDVEYGSALMAVGGIGLVIGLITYFRSRQSSRRQPQGYDTAVQQPIYRTVAQQTQYQPIQPVDQQAVGQKQKFCTNCGGKIEDNMTACAHCGANI